jgi:hypothetical protein
MKIIDVSGEPPQWVLDELNDPALCAAIKADLAADDAALLESKTIVIEDEQEFFKPFNTGPGGN